MSQMVNSSNKQVVEAPASTSATGNGVFVAKPVEEAAVLSSINVQCEGQANSSPLGPRSNDDLRPLRSTCLSNDLAASWQACGREIPRETHTDPHSAWARCEVCALQLWYQPRKGSPSSHTAVHNEVMVQRALTQLQPMLHGALPTEEIVKAMLDKITAKEKLNIKVQYLLETPNVESSKKVPKSKAAPKNAEKKLVVTRGYMMGQSSPATSPSGSS